jgi:5-(hydroxymethyl)furfural/furfural oxidase
LRRRCGLRAGEPALGALGRIPCCCSKAGRDTRLAASPPTFWIPIRRPTYNAAYFWPELKVHWRLASNSPLTGYSQGRIMGGGSSVMGMVALRGTPDDYAEWEDAGATGWGWNDVLPFFRKLETDKDFSGAMHGTDGPVPIWRLPKDRWPPISTALQSFADERQIPFVADMNGDFRDGYAVAPISNWPDKRASACDLLSHRRCARAKQSHHRERRDGDRQSRSTADGATGVSASIGGETKTFSGRRGHRQSRRHPFVGDADALRHRSRGASARSTVSRCALTCRASARTCQPFAAVHRVSLEARGAAVAELRSHSATVLRYSSGVPGCPPTDMYINVQSKTSWSALGTRIGQSRAVDVEADGPRAVWRCAPRITGRSRWSR